MKETMDLEPDAADLRRRAEERLQAWQAPAGQTLTEAQSQRLIHELQVHQIELKLQNEALRETRTQLEQSLERYTDLYDFAPVGYFIVTGDSTILEANLTGATLVGLERSSLIGRRFGLFVSAATRPCFNRFLSQVLTGTIRESCEVTLDRQGEPSCHVHLEGVGMASPEGQRCRLAISERKATEQSLRGQTEELRKRNEELQRFNRAMVGRELDMIALKKQVNQLSRQLGQEPPYPLAFLNPPEQDSSDEGNQVIFD